VEAAGVVDVRTGVCVGTDEILENGIEVALVLGICRIFIFSGGAH
jgi:hypothetical protein